MLINESRWLNYIFRDLRILKCCSSLLGCYAASTGHSYGHFEGSSVTNTSNAWVLSLSNCLEIESGQQLRRFESSSYNVFINSVIASVFVAL
jgi:hypothetical protein